MLKLSIGREIKVNVKFAHVKSHISCKHNALTHIITSPTHINSFTDDIWHGYFGMSKHNIFQLFLFHHSRLVAINTFNGPIMIHGGMIDDVSDVI